MKLDQSYDLVVAMDHPQGESSTGAYDVWAREVRAKITALLEPATVISGVRVVRSRNHLKVSFRVDRWASMMASINVVLVGLAPLAPENVTLHIHEVEIQEEGN